MDDINLESIAVFEAKLINNFEVNYPHLVHEFNRQGELTAEVHQAFTDSLEAVRYAWFERTNGS